MNKIMQVRNCYSYSRVSRTSQAEIGLGLQRQQELIKNFLKDKPEYKLVNTIQDAGVSGFTGDNVLDGAGLGCFINQVKAGAIPEDSLLIVESVDRISRGGIRAARKIFSTLLDNKVNVALLKMGIIVKHDDVNDISSELLLSVGAYLGFLESQQKSERIKKTFDLQREQASNGKKIKIAVRPWLKLSEDQLSFEILPEPLATLKRLFDLKLSGLGVLKIAQMLNDDGTPPLSGKVWNATTVTNHLKHRSVIGEYHPKVVVMKDGKKKRVPAPSPILNYYPQVISSDIFLATQSTFIKANATKVRANVNFHNLFKGFIKCKCCGGSLGWQQGVNVGGKTYEPRLYCNTRKVGKLNCEQKTFYYPQLETGLVNLLSHLDYSKLADTKDYSNDIQILEGELLTADKKIENFTHGIGLAEDLTTITLLTGKLQAEQRERESIAIKLSELRSKAIDSTSDTNLIDVDTVSPEGRMRLHKFLSQYIERIITDGEIASIKFFTHSTQFNFNLKDLSIHLNYTLQTLETAQYKRINLIEFYKNLSIDLIDLHDLHDLQD